MRPLGKGMKVGRKEGIPEKETLRDVLRSYRQTPHPATGLPPASMLFRDGYRGDFPRQDVTDADINLARARDANLKKENELSVNSSKYRKASDFKVGDMVYVRNFQRRRKFDPLFLENPFEVVEINDCGNKLQVKDLQGGQAVWRHPDDLKSCFRQVPLHTRTPSPTEEEIIVQDESYGEESYFDTLQGDQLVPEPVVLPEEPLPLRRSNRTAVSNPRYTTMTMW